MLYAKHEMIVDYVIEGTAKEILLGLLQNDALRQEVIEQIEKTIIGQYQPRLDLARAFAKLYS